MTEPVLTVNDLRVTFRARFGMRPFTAVDGISFQIEQAGRFGLVGESGSGKSTTARAVLGLVPTAPHTILFHGRDLAAQRTAEPLVMGTRIQAIFQDPYSSLNPVFSIGTSMVRALRQRFPSASHDELRTRARSHLESVGLPVRVMDRRPTVLSGGQRQRVAIARALSVEPELLVCDEPTSALDMTTRAQVMGLVTELQRERGFSILFITHDLPLVRHLCDVIAVIHHGRIVESAPSKELFGAPRDPYTQRLIAAIPTIRTTRSAATIQSAPLPLHPPTTSHPEEIRHVDR